MSGTFDNNLKPKAMKKLIYILAVILITTSLVGCQKEETPQSNNDATSYFYSMKGEQFEKIQAEVYEVDHLDAGTCEGFFIKPLNHHFDFIVEIDGGLPDEVLQDSNLSSMEFEVDLEFTGVAYNCKRSYKTEPGENRGYPVEIQKVTISNYTITN